MSRGEQERLGDIKNAIAAIREHLERAEMTGEEGGSDLLHDALLFQFMVIGEAVKNLDDTTRQSMPTIPWRGIAGLRDMIAHEYFGIDMERVMDIVERDLAPLEDAIDRLLEGQ